MILPYSVLNPKVGILFEGGYMPFLGSKNRPCGEKLFWCANQSFFNLHPKKIDMESENDGFQKDYSFPGADFQVSC